MSLWTSSVLSLLLLSAQLQAQEVSDDNKPVVAVLSEEQPRPLVFAKKDWALTQAYFDVFKIVSTQNTCSSFYGGPDSATTVLNRFATQIESRTLEPEISFQMRGRPLKIYDPSVHVSYRLFQRTTVNTKGSFYQRRSDWMRRFPPDIGDFAPGTRQARALILLHELGHLIEGEEGDWLIPDDGYSGSQSKANTLRIQQACRKELEALK